MRVKTEEDKTEIKTDSMAPVHPTDNLRDTMHWLEKAREKNREAYKPWTEEMDDELTVMYCEGVTIRDIAKHFGRSKDAIRSRIKKLELEELYG